MKCQCVVCASLLVSGHAEYLILVYIYVEVVVISVILEAWEAHLMRSDPSVRYCEV